MSDDSAVFTRVVGYMNEQRPDTLLLFAWNLFGYNNATQATMESIDSTSFKLSIKNKSFIPSLNTRITKVYKFEPPLLNASESRDRLVRLSEKYSFCPFPYGFFATYVSLGLWATSLCGIIQAKELLQYKPVEMLHNTSLLIYKTPEYAAYTLIALAVLHALEVAYVLYLLKNIPLSSANKQSWITWDLVLGYPVTMLAVNLSKVIKKQPKKNL